MFDGSHFSTKPAGTPPARDQLDELIRRAQADRARVVGEAIADAIARAVDAVRRWDAKRIAVRELSAMDDRLLRDIGVSRDEIKDVVDRAERMGSAARGELLAGFVRTAIVEPFRRWRLRTRTRAELSALDDSMLRDIGIERGQIDGIAEAVANGQAFDRGEAYVAGQAGGVPEAANTNTRRAYPANMVDAAD